MHLRRVTNIKQPTKMQHLKSNYFKMFSPIDQESTLQIFSEDLPLPIPLPREKQEEFVAHTSIKVPKEQAYRVLLAKTS
jgi:hypothetical protein